MDEVLFWIAIASTGAFAIKLVLMLVGLETEVDIDGGDVFSINFALAFLMSQSWSALAFMEKGYETITAILFSIVIASVFAGLFLFILNKARHMESRVLNKLGVNAGDRGEVFLTIGKDGVGKVKISINGTVMNLNATSLGEDIKTGSQVEVIEVNGETLVVKPV